MSTELLNRRACRAGCAAVAVVLFASSSGAQDVGGGGDEIIATKKSKVYHDRACSSAKKIGGANKVRFESVEEAERSGRRRCRFCERVAAKEAAPPPERRSEGTGAPNERSKPPDAPRPGKPGPARAETPTPPGVEGRIKEVLPGGTLVRDNGDRLRLVGVSCPEAGQALAQDAVRFIQRQTRRRTVLMEIPTDAEGRVRRDALGRVLATVRVQPGNVDLASELLRKGLAWLDHEFRSGQHAEYQRLVDAAAWGEQGVWARAAGKAGRRPVVIGKHAAHFHAPDCPHVPHLTDTKTVTINQAKDKRLTPCRLFRAAPRPKP